MLSKGLLVMIQKELIFILFKHQLLDKFNKLSLPEGLFEDRHLPRTNTKNQYERASMVLKIYFNTSTSKFQWIS